MTINQAGLDLIKSFEGCRLEAYQDIVGIWTVGFGHTGPDVVAGLTIDQSAADALLAKDLEKFELGVTSLVMRDITSNQFSALVSFSYNLGLDALKQSTLLRCVNKNNFADAAQEFLKWDRAGGIVVPGLLRRRQAESSLFKLS